MLSTDQIQAGAAIASVIVALGAVIIALMAWRAERSQAEVAKAALAEAKRQADAADASERSRRWDERVQAIRPLVAERPGPPAIPDRGDYAGRTLSHLPIRAEVPALDLRVILHGTVIGGWDTTFNIVGSVGAGETRLVPLDVTDMARAANASRPDRSPYHLELYWAGQLGQRVVQEFMWDFVGHLLDSAEPNLRMVRWRVDPQVDGMEELDLQFSESPK